MQGRENRDGDHLFGKIKLRNDYVEGRNETDTHTEQGGAAET